MAVLGTQIVATLIAVYGLFMTPLGWPWALFVWGYALTWAVATDRVKLLAYRILDSVKAEPKSAAKADSISESKVEPKPAAEAVSKPEAKTESKPEVKAESKPDANATADLTPQIAKRAYELYEQRDRKDGRSVQDWDKAEREIRKGGSKAGPTPEAKAETKSRSQS